MIISTFIRNQRKVQVRRKFNYLGEQETPSDIPTEYVVNVIARSFLNIKAQIVIVIFDDRMEMHCSSSLLNGQTVKDMKNGATLLRKVFLFTNTNYLLQYTEAEDGVRHNLEYNSDGVFSNCVSNKEISHIANGVVIIMPRRWNHARLESKQDNSSLITPRLTQGEEI